MSLVENCTFQPPGAVICEFSTNIGEKVFRNNVVNSDWGTALRGDFSFGRLIVTNNLFYGSQWFYTAMNTAASYVEVANNTMVFKGGWLANWALLAGTIELDTLYFYNNIASGPHPQIWVPGDVDPAAHIKHLS